MGEKTHVGELQEDGTIKFNCNIDDWYSNMEFEECEDCIQYPLCGARRCPYKRMISTDGNRQDCCKNETDEFYKKVEAFIESSGVFD